MAIDPVLLAPGADDNGLAVMLRDLVRQNLEAKPHKRSDFDKMTGSVAIVADDAEVALTLRFDGGKLTIYDGIVGIPDVTVRGTSDAILAMSNMPLTTRFALPFPSRSDVDGRKIVADMIRDTRSGALHVYGMFTNAPMLLHLTRIMSVNG